MAMKFTNLRGITALIWVCGAISTMFLLLQNVLIVSAMTQCWTPYDPTAYNECYSKPKNLLYGGGMVINPDFNDGLNGWFAMGNCNLQIRHQNDDCHMDDEDYNNAFMVATNRTASYNGPSQSLPNLMMGVKYTVSAWLQVNGTSTPLRSTIKATITTLTNKGREFKTIGIVLAQNGCWTFLKGGFVLQNAPIDPFNGQLYFETYEFKKDMEIWLDRVSVQPFTDEEWTSHQNAQKEMLHRRSVSVRVVDSMERGVNSVRISLVDVRPKFNFGSAITKYFLSNEKYQEWFAARFNTAVMGNEMKWYWNEATEGVEAWSDAEALMAWCQSRRIGVRGHNIIWEDPAFVQPWLKNLSSTPLLLRAALRRRLSSLLRRFHSRVLSWDVSNEQLHFSFFELALQDPNLSTDLFLAAQSFRPPQPQPPPLPPPLSWHFPPSRRHDPADLSFYRAFVPPSFPLPPPSASGPLLFVNDYNTLEEPDDLLASPDNYLAALRRLLSAGVAHSKLAIGLESHFGSKPPDLAFIRATLDRLATLGLPIWLTELDVHVTALRNNLTQAAAYLDQVLREAFSHPAVEGIVMWASIDDAAGNCWRMCLTDTNMSNLPTGNVVDTVLQEWLQVDMLPLSSAHNQFQWRGPVGWHTVSLHLPSHNTTYHTTLTVSPGHGTQHFLLQIPDSNSPSLSQQLLVFPHSTD